MTNFKILLEAKQAADKSHFKMKLFIDYQRLLDMFMCLSEGIPFPQDTNPSTHLIN